MVDCFESIVNPGRHSQGEMLARPADLTAASGAGDLRLLDPSKVLFDAGAGWITPAFTLPRAARFSTPRYGAFYVAEEITTAVEKVRHHIQQDCRWERITGPMDLDCDALTFHDQGSFHDIRSKARTGSRGQPSTILIPMWPPGPSRIPSGPPLPAGSPMPACADREAPTPRCSILAASALAGIPPIYRSAGTAPLWCASWKRGSCRCR